MAKVTNLLLADAIRQEKSGKFIFVGTYFDVELDERPGPSDLFALAVIDGLESGSHTLKIRLVDRTAKRAAVSPLVDIEIDEKGEKVVHILEMRQFIFPSSGIYSLIAEVDGERLGRHDFKITFPPDVDGA